MTKFNYLCNICGSNKPFTARIKLTENVDVEKGEIVYFNENTFGVTPKKGNLTSVAGVCAQTYKAAPDRLVPYYGSGEISVIVSKDALYSVAPVFITDNGSVTNGGIGTDIAQTAITESAGIVGSKLVLVSKENFSKNTAIIGSVHTITSATISNGYVVFKTDTGVIGTEGDRYVFVPAYGFELLKRNADGELVLQFDEKGGFTVMEASENGYVLKISDIR